MKPEHETLQGALRKAWSPATARQWTPERPAAGQCNVTALVVQDRLGGAILRTRIGGAWHFYNRIAGERIDFTVEQFLEAPNYEDIPSGRDEAFAGTKQSEYEALSSRLSDLLTEGE